MNSIKNESRTPARIRTHYEIERELANKLRNASRQQRRHLYSSLYGELYRRVTDHPLLTPRSPLEIARAIRAQLKFAKRFIRQDTTFLEVGPGDCALSLEVAKFVKQVFAVDVSGEISKAPGAPENFTLILSDGCTIPVPANSVNVAYSYQLMEHLHPDDAVEQLQNIYKALVRGGIYLCVTPNRLTGPHDVSMYFDTEATGFHLKEYTISELRLLFKRSGFSRVHAYVGARGTYVRLSPVLLILCEKFLGMLPSRLGKTIARSLLFRMLLNIRLGAIK